MKISDIVLIGPSNGLTVNVKSVKKIYKLYIMTAIQAYITR